MTSTDGPSASDEFIRVFGKSRLTSRRGLSRPLPAANSVPRCWAAGSEGATKYLSMIGIWRRFILGVITTIWFVLISIQSAEGEIIGMITMFNRTKRFTFLKGQWFTSDLPSLHIGSAKRWKGMEDSTLTMIMFSRLSIFDIL